jgi:D-alanyl-lipoteichoic acid acyltransferase DltB (MBOAT superfamily)
MFFNSATFLFGFLPIVLAGFFLLERFGSLFARQAWLLAASLVFYAWGNASVLALFLPLTAINYLLGSALQRRGESGGKWLLVLAVGLNVLVLCYFKYANFFVTNLNAVLEANLFIEKILLPLGISFITFMQIAWLVGCRRGETLPCSYFEFLLFSAFFPQIISGPIVYQKETQPQFRKTRGASERATDICVGVTIFTMGLAKKVLVADTIAPWANQGFWAVGADQPITLVAAWIGALAYAFQLYFDFSGYSDMAIGIARLFGIRLPLNFNSPYKAENISDFWRRWHMTLSRFLRDFVYIGLGGNRCGSVRRSANLFLTMLLGGFWHGAGWTFIFWGALHGSYLVVNHAWTSLLERTKIPGAMIFAGWGGRALTFLAVLVSWIFFRAEHPAEAFRMMAGMVGANGIFVIGDPLFFKSSPNLLGVFSWFGCQADPQFVLLGCLVGLGVFVSILPNSQQILAALEPGIVTYGKKIEEIPAAFRALAWRPSVGWLAGTLLVFIWCMLNLSNVSSFLYKDF